MMKINCKINLIGHKLIKITIQSLIINILYRFNNKTLSILIMIIYNFFSIKIIKFKVLLIKNNYQTNNFKI